tara:strand:- start:445 stop:726 length:282 start_codon:yes stop_codon:yes gene_type:complete
MLLPNVAEEAGVSIYTVKNALKAANNTSEQEKKLEALEEKWSRQRRIRVLIRLNADCRTRIVTCKSIQNNLVKRRQTVVSISSIRQYLRADGY